jgi:hypothetical protein
VDGVHHAVHAQCGVVEKAVRLQRLGRLQHRQP